jgi:hypothetical protein
VSENIDDQHEATLQFAAPQIEINDIDDDQQQQHQQTELPPLSHMTETTISNQQTQVKQIQSTPIDASISAFEPPVQTIATQNIQHQELKQNSTNQQQQQEKQFNVLSDVESEIDEKKYQSESSIVHSSGDDGRVTSPECVAADSILNRSRSMPATSATRASTRINKKQQQHERSNSTSIDGIKHNTRTSSVRRKKFVKQQAPAPVRRMKMGILDLTAHVEPPKRVVSPKRRRRKA